MSRDAVSRCWSVTEQDQQSVRWWRQERPGWSSAGRGREHEPPTANGKRLPIAPGARAAEHPPTPTAQPPPREPPTANGTTAGHARQATAEREPPTRRPRITRRASRRHECMPQRPRAATACQRTTGGPATLLSVGAPPISGRHVAASLVAASLAVASGALRPGQRWTAPAWVGVSVLGTRSNSPGNNTDSAVRSFSWRILATTASAGASGDTRRATVHSDSPWWT